MANRSNDRRRAQGQVSTWPPRDAARAGSLPENGIGIWSSWAELLKSWLRAEAGPGRLLPWVPVAFGTGIAAYFAAVTAAALCVVAFLARRHPIFPVLVMLAALSAGFAAAALKAARIAHGVLARPMFSVSIKGFVETHEERERTDRFVLRVEEMDTPKGFTKLERVRLSVKKGAAPAVGSFVELKARLLPPLSPLRPGSYDFGRDMYFQGIGASGFAMGTIKTVEAPRSGGTYLRYAATMQGMRDAIDARIRSVLSGDNRAIATALLTGRVSAMYCRSPAITWRWLRAWCSSRCGRCSRCFPR